MAEAGIVTVTVRADTTQFVEAIARATRAVRRFQDTWDRLYLRTGVEPYGGTWDRWQMVADR